MRGGLCAESSEVHGLKFLGIVRQLRQALLEALTVARPHLPSTGFVLRPKETGDNRGLFDLDAAETAAREFDFDFR